VTGTPASGDMVLFPCESFIFRDEWPYLIEALEQAEFYLLP
jgi:hypothetical protein